MTLNVVILAAGQGTRMRSAKPKVIHELAGKPMLGHVLETARALDPTKIVVVYGHGGEQVVEAIGQPDLSWVEQAEQLGTGHAVQQALPVLDGDSACLVLYGDVPLIQAETLNKLVAETAEDKLALLTVVLGNPAGYGRIVKDAAGVVTAIVEEKDASAEQKQICEVNTGVMAIPGQYLSRWLGQLDNNNAQGEYYLTDLVAMAHQQGVAISAIQALSAAEVAGVNNKQQLAELEREYQHQLAGRLMEAGATLADPARIDVRGELNIGRDVVIDVNCVFSGKVTLEDGVAIGPNCVIEDSVIGAGSVIKANSVLEQAVIGASCEVGPFARLRPGTRLSARAKVGNFVETKKAIVGEGSKLNHLSYVGDAEIGVGVNIGAGTITCNYDGVNKFTTRIEDGAFIGSNSSLVAPVTIGSGATVGAGSTIGRDAPANKLTLTRAKQKTVDSWKRPEKK